MTTTTATVRDILDAAQYVHDAMREVFYRLEGGTEVDDVAQALNELEDAAEHLERARAASRAVLDQRGA